MSNYQNKSRRQTILTTARAIAMFMLALVVIGVAILVFRPTPEPSTTTTIIRQPAAVSQTDDKVAQGATFLKDVGFNQSEPEYIGITAGSELNHPTYRVTALGGHSIDVWLRTDAHGGMTFQPMHYYGTEPMATAMDLANAASSAVYDWQNKSAYVKPRTDGAYGDYEELKYDYDLLKQYVVDDSVFTNNPDETAGWPGK